MLAGNMIKAFFVLLSFELTSYLFRKDLMWSFHSYKEEFL